MPEPSYLTTCDGNPFDSRPLRACLMRLGERSTPGILGFNLAFLLGKNHRIEGVSYLSHEKKPPTFHGKSWLVYRDPYKGLL